MPLPGAVREEGGQLVGRHGDVRHPVDGALARRHRPRGPRDEVGDQVPGQVPVDHLGERPLQRRAVAEVPLVEQPAPPDVPAVAHLRLREEQVPAERLEAVGEDHQIELARAPVVELQGGRFRRRPCARRAPCGPGGRWHRARGGAASARGRPSAAPPRPARAPTRSCRSGRPPRRGRRGASRSAAVGEVGVEEVARHQGAEGRHRHGDPRPAPDKRAARTLEDRDIMAGARQRDGGGAAGDGAADDADAEAAPGRRSIGQSVMLVPPSRSGAIAAACPPARARCRAGASRHDRSSPARGTAPASSPAATRSALTAPGPPRSAPQ